MVELRKRPPPQEPPAPAPAAKRGKKASNLDNKTKPASKQSAIMTKARTVASKVKESVPALGDSGDAKQPEPAKAEAVPGSGESTSNLGAKETAPGMTDAPAPISASTAAADGLANLPPTHSPAESKTVRDKAIALGVGSQTMSSAPEPAAPAAPAAPEADTRPPATEDLENPPEKAKIDTSAASNTTTEPTGLPLSTASVGKLLPLTSTAFTTSIPTHSGSSITLSALLETSGLIIFTYPRASTPGCTQQACLFRDNHAAFTSSTATASPSGSKYAIYGLSTDSPKANTTFATKQNLQYPLLCDQEAVLTGALGMKKPGNAKGTLRGVVVLERGGAVKLWAQGGPAKTVELVKEFLKL